MSCYMIYDGAIVALATSKLDYKDALELAKKEYPQHPNITLVQIAQYMWNKLADEGHMTHELGTVKSD